MYLTKNINNIEARAAAFELNDNYLNVTNITSKDSTSTKLQGLQPIRWEADWTTNQTRKHCQWVTCIEVYTPLVTIMSIVLSRPITDMPWQAKMKTNNNFTQEYDKILLNQTWKKNFQSASDIFL